MRKKKTLFPDHLRQLQVHGLGQPDSGSAKDVAVAESGQGRADPSWAVDGRNGELGISGLLPQISASSSNNNNFDLCLMYVCSMCDNVQF